MLDSTEYQELDALSIARGIRDGEFTACEITELAIARAENLNPSLNAITWQTFEQATDQARLLDSTGSPVGSSPLAGVPFLIKDNNAVQGLPQTCHSRLFADEIADRDSAAVDAFRRAGLIFLGKTNTPELCLTLTTESEFAGPCRNPWNLDHSTGGSSGGSAAAVAARIVPVAQATDGGGSTRVPASCCGLVGLKPSRGLTPYDPRQGQGWSGLSVGHVVSRTVRDSAAMLDAVRLDAPVLYPLPPGPASFLASMTTQPELRVAIQREHPLGAPIDPEVEASLELAVELLEQMGYDLREAVPPVDYRTLAEYAGRIINASVAEIVMPQLEKRGLDLDTPMLEESTRRMARRGAVLTATDYVEALDFLTATAADMQAFHRDFDVLVSPVLTQPPARLGWLDMNSDDMRTYAQRFTQYGGFCALFNATGQPSISLPLHMTATGLPVGVLFSAAWGQDLRLLQLAWCLEQELQWQRRKPPLFC